MVQDEVLVVELGEPTDRVRSLGGLKHDLGLGVEEIGLVVSAAVH